MSLRSIAWSTLLRALPRCSRALTSRSSAGLNPILSRSSHTGKLAEDLQKADLKFKSSEWVLMVVGLGVLVGLLVALRFANPVAFLPCPVIVWLRFAGAMRGVAFQTVTT